MSTFLFDKIIFGPVKSRRLGVSLGVNLLTPSSKHCNFDCIYCECGWNADHPGGHFNSADAVIRRLEAKLIEMKETGELPNYITFAGNGEPTMHPDFASIIDRTIDTRNTLSPETKIAVLSNATMIDRPAVRNALERVDRNILKFDSALEPTQRLINQANSFRPIAEQIELLKQFGGRQVIQTMLLRGTYNGATIDNTTPEELAAYTGAMTIVAPGEIMLYSIDRDTPASGLQKVSKEELETIAEQLRAAGLRNITIS